MYGFVKGSFAVVDRVLLDCAIISTAVKRSDLFGPWKLGLPLTDFNFKGDLRNDVLAVC